LNVWTEILGTVEFHIARVAVVGERISKYPLSQKRKRRSVFDPCMPNG
jgi:hypothetical protein